MTTDIDSIKIVAKDLLQISFTNAVISNSAVISKDNYSVSLVNGSGSLNIKEIIIDDSSLLNLIYLRIEPLTEGVEYEVEVNNLTDSTGYVLNAKFEIIAYITKTDSILRSIPRHFDKSVNSTIRNLLSAFSIEDDIIGGAKDELIINSYPTRYITEDGNYYLVTEDGDHLVVE